MLQASAVQIQLSPADVQLMLLSRAAGQVDDLTVAAGDGALTVKVRLSGGALPILVTAELRFTVLEVQPDRVRLGVEWPNLALVPGAVKEMALKRAFGGLPGHYADGIYTVPATELIPEMPVSFRIETVFITPEGVLISLREVVLFAVAPAPLAEPLTEDATEQHSYYQKLRARMSAVAAERAPSWVQPMLPWLLAAPDFFVLLARLARDPRVPASAKWIAGAGVAYFIAPVDLIPDLLPLLGHIDDLGLALLALEQIAKQVPPEAVQELWPGDGKVLEQVNSGLAVFTRALPARVLVALRQKLRRGR